MPYALYAVLERLHQLAPLFAPKQLIADFEDAPAAAFRAVFGEQLQISGCWFHYVLLVLSDFFTHNLRKLPNLYIWLPITAFLALFSCLAFSVAPMTKAKDNVTGGN